MIDTIVLTLNSTQFTIIDHSRFSPSTENLFNPPFLRLGAKGNFQCVQNPTQKDKEAGIYKPRLTVTKRMQRGGFGIDLRIEFSAPKLLWNNNFDEVEETDFDRVLEVLQKRLEEMAVKTDMGNYRRAI